MNERIKLVRSKLGIKQGEFAKKLNVSQNTISAIEHSISKVTDRMVRDICRVYNVNEHWLRTGEGEMFNALSRDEKLAGMMGELLAEEEYSIKKMIIEFVLNAPDALFDYAEQFINEKRKENK